MTPDELLEQFHTQVRLHDRDAAPGFVVDRDGPVHRTYPPDAGGARRHGRVPRGPRRRPRPLGRAAGGVLQRRGARSWSGRPTATTSRPTCPSGWCGPGSSPTTPRSCCSAGAPTWCTTSTLPDGTRLREITSDEDWERVRVSVDPVWGEDTSWVNDALRAEQRRDPDLLIAVVAEDAATLEVLSYGVLRLQPGTEFCGLWGGSTLAQWRGAGCTARSPRTAPGWPSTAATPTPAWTPHRTRAPSSSGSGCTPWPTPGPTCSTPAGCGGGRFADPLTEPPDAPFGCRCPPTAG